MTDWLWAIVCLYIYSMGMIPMLLVSNDLKNCNGEPFKPWQRSLLAVLWLPVIAALTGCWTAMWTKHLFKALNDKAKGDWDVRRLVPWRVK